MKTWINLWIVWLWALNLYGWEISINNTSSYPDEGRAILEYGSDLLVVGTVRTGPFSFQRDVFVGRYAQSDGSVIWQKRYGYGNDDFAYKAILSNNELVIVGYSVNGSYADLWIFKVDPATGNVINELRLDLNNPFSDDDLAFRIGEDATYFLVTGMTRGGADVDFFLVRINKASFSVSGVWIYDVGGNDRGYSILAHSNGDYYICGTTTAGAGATDLMLVRISSSTGNIVWAKAYGGGDYDQGYDLIEHSDGSILVVGGTQSYPAPGAHEGWVVRIDAGTGALISNMTLGDGMSAKDDHFEDISSTIDGGYVLTGHFGSSLGHGSNDASIVKLSPTLTYEWAYAIGTSGNEFGYDIIQTSSGIYALTGFNAITGQGNNIYIAAHNNPPTNCNALSASLSINTSFSPTITSLGSSRRTGFSSGGIGAAINNAGVVNVICPDVLPYYELSLLIRNSDVWRLKLSEGIEVDSLWLEKWERDQFQIVTSIRGYLKEGNSIDFPSPSVPGLYRVRVLTVDQTLLFSNGVVFTLFSQKPHIAISSESLYIQFPSDGSDSWQIEIYNLSGRLLFWNETSQPTYRIPLGYLISPIVVIHLQSATETYVYKLRID